MLNKGYLLEIVTDIGSGNNNGMKEFNDYTEKQDLVDEPVQIFTVFNCRLQGKCIDKARKMTRELIQNDAD